MLSAILLKICRCSKTQGDRVIEARGWEYTDHGSVGGDSILADALWRVGPSRQRLPLRSNINSAAFSFFSQLSLNCLVLSSGFLPLSLLSPLSISSILSRRSLFISRSMSITIFSRQTIMSVEANINSGVKWNCKGKSVWYDLAGKRVRLFGKRSRNQSALYDVVVMLLNISIHLFFLVTNCLALILCWRATASRFLLRSTSHLAWHPPARWTATLKVSSRALVAGIVGLQAYTMKRRLWSGQGMKLAMFALLCGDSTPRSC